MTSTDGGNDVPNMDQEQPVTASLLKKPDEIEVFVSIQKLTDEEIAKYVASDQGDLEGDDGSALSTDRSLAILIPSSNDAAPLLSDDDIHTIEIDRNARRKIQDYDKCIIDENLVTKYNQMRKRSGSTLPLFCLYCFKDYHNVNTIVSCYLKHLKHFAYRCDVCEEATLDARDMFTHFTRTHPQLPAVKFRRVYVPAIERWVKKFITYQVMCVTNQAVKIPNSILHKFCPVCNQYDYEMNKRVSKTKNQNKLNPIYDRNHIQKHMQYHPFQCQLCLKQGERFNLSMVNRKARKHLMEKHGFADPSEKELTDNFPPICSIPAVERYLNSYVSIVKDNFEVAEKTPTAPKSSRKPKASSTPRAPRVSRAKSRGARTPRRTIVTESTPQPSTSRGTSGGSSAKRTPLRRSSSSSSSSAPKYICLDPEDCHESTRSSFSGSCSSNEDDSIAIDLDNYLGLSETPPTPPPLPAKDVRLCLDSPNAGIICIFCEAFTSGPLTAWEHYSAHLGYRGLICMVCDDSFAGSKSFLLHGAEHPYYDNIPYKWKHDLVIENWISSMVDSFEKIDKIVAHPDYAGVCPICSRKYKKIMPPIDIGELEYEQIRRHIYVHLRYQPYQCKLCPTSEDEAVYVADLENDGATHLSSYHQIPGTVENLLNNFINSHGIDSLDDYVRNHFNLIKETIRRLEESPPADDAVCDVAQLFSDVQDTIGSSTLNNILDNATLAAEGQSVNLDQPLTSSEPNGLENPAPSTSAATEAVDETPQENP